MSYGFEDLCNCYITVKNKGNFFCFFNIFYISLQSIIKKVKIMVITQETREKNLRLFFNKLSQLGIDTTQLEKKYSHALEYASFTASNEFGNACPGSLLDILLKTLTPYAVKINELLPDDVKVDKNVLVKICLLHQIAKSIRLIPNDNTWEIEKRFLSYKYNNDLPSIRTGLHSLIMAQECGISFNESEAEAMTVNDRDLTDDQARWHSSILASIVRQSSELTYLTLNRK